MGRRLVVPILCTIAFFPMLGQEALIQESVPQAEKIWANHWTSFIAAKNSQSEEAIKNTLDVLKADIETNSAFANYASYLLLQEGLHDMERGRYDVARTQFLTAIQFNQNLWPAYEGLAQIKLQRDKSYKSYLTLSLKGIRHAFGVDNHLFLLASIKWFLQKLVLTIKLLFLLLAFVFAIRYARPALATTKHALEKNIKNDWWGKLVAFTLLFTPFFLGFNAFLAGALILILFFPFLAGKERAVMLGTCVFLALTVPMLWMAQNIGHAISDPYYSFLVQKPIPSTCVEAELHLKSVIGKTGGDDLKAYALAYAVDLQEKHEEALEFYNRIPANSHFQPLAKNNLGNIYFEFAEYQKAIDHYKKAIELGAGVETHFNLSLALTQVGNISEAESELRIVRRQNPTLTKSYTFGDQAKVLQAELPFLASLKMALFGQSGNHTAAGILNIPVLAPSIIGILTLILCLVHSRMRNARLLAKACDKCGRVFFASESPNSEWCGQCVNLYVRKDDLPSEAKMKKYDEVKAFSARKKWFQNISQLLLPGSKSLLKGSAITGSISILFWLLLVLLVLSSAKEIGTPMVHFLSSDLVLKIGVGIVMLLFWIIFGIRGLWQED